MSNKPLKPLVRGGGVIPSDNWTPLVYPGGKTTHRENCNVRESGGGDQNSKAEEGKDADR